jgi:hypothetical protein
MTPWISFTQENVMRVPEGLLGVFQLSRTGDGIISFVGRADDDLRQRLLDNLDKGYVDFQYAPLPWVKETYEMQCRLYHHAGGRKCLDNADHPYPPEGKLWRCAISATTPAMCEH